MYYNGFINEQLPDVLTKEELNNLFYEYKNGNMEARNKIIEHNIRLVLYRVSTRFYDTDYEKEDLISIGLIGLIKSVDNFNPNKKCEFSTYASRCIDNQISISLRKRNYKDTISLNSMMEESDTGILLEERIGNKIDFEEKYFEKEILLYIKSEFEKLSARNKDIIFSYYGLNGNTKTQEALSLKYNISRSRIYKIIKDETDKVRIKVKKIENI